MNGILKEFEDINNLYPDPGKDDYCYNVVYLIHMSLFVPFLIVSFIITQKLISVAVLYWDRTVPAVWSDLWDWQIWGKCVWAREEPFHIWSARNLHKAHSFVFNHVPQVRHYDSVKWVSTDETSLFMEIAAMRAFKRLFNYIAGANENGALFIYVLFNIYWNM